jgi:hypothetical protein
MLTAPHPYPGKRLVVERIDGLPPARNLEEL